MSGVRFFDTNILVYAYDRDASARHLKALQLVEESWDAPDQVAISVQVLQELFVNLRKNKVSLKDAVAVVNDLRSWTVIENTVDILMAGLKEHERWNISPWDGLILAAARAAGARELVSEDFNHGQDYDGIRVVNPFR